MKEYLILFERIIILNTILLICNTSFLKRQLYIIIGESIYFTSIGGAVPARNVFRLTKSGALNTAKEDDHSSDRAHCLNWSCYYEK